MSILQNIHSQSHNPVLLLAGHRDGLLVMVHLTLDTEGHFIVSRIPSYYTIGSTSVVVKSNAETPNIALVCCDSKIWRISFDGRQHSDPILNRIWFTDVDEVSLLVSTAVRLDAELGFSHMTHNRLSVRFVHCLKVYF